MAPLRRRTRASAPSASHTVRARSRARQQPRPLRHPLRPGYGRFSPPRDSLWTAAPRHEEPMVLTSTTPLATAAGPHLFWLASRAAGIAALILSSAAVGAGLLLSGRLRKVRGPDLRVVHEALSLATLAALAVHGL